MTLFPYTTLFRSGTHVAADSARADLSFKNGTLYTDTAQTEGFSVSPNVNVVLALAAKNHGDAFDDVDDNYTGYTGVETALKNLDKSADKFDGFLCAVIEDGAATSIIFDERAGANRTNLEPVKPMRVTVNKVDTNGNQLGTEAFDWNGTPFTGSEVTSPANYTWQSATSLTFVEGQTGTVTFTYKSKSALVAPDNAVALYDGGTNAFAVLYSGTVPAGNGLAALLIDAAKAAGFPNAQAERNAVGTGWTITDATGVIKLNATFLDANVKDSWVGKIDGNKVYVSKNGGTSLALNALNAFGNASESTTLTGTYVKVNKATGLSATVTSGTDTFAAVTANVTGDGFDVTTKGYVKVTGTDVKTAKDNQYVSVDANLTALMADDFNTAGTGTGMTYTIGGTAKYVPYGGTIAKSELTNDVSFVKGFVKVTVVMAEDPTDSFKVITAADATGFTDAAGETYVAVGGNITVSNETAGGSDDVYVAISDGDTVSVANGKVSNGTNKVQAAANKDVTVTIKKTA